MDIKYKTIEENKINTLKLLIDSKIPIFPLKKSTILYPSNIIFAKCYIRNNYVIHYILL